MSTFALFLIIVALASIWAELPRRTVTERYLERIATALEELAKASKEK